MVYNEFPLTVVALVVVLLLTVVSRWVFATKGPRYGRKELKLLTVIATGVPRAEAMAMRATLGDAGIRSTMQKRWDERMDILVFYGDVERGKALLGL